MHWLQLFTVVLASSGDRLPEFKSCVQTCTEQCPHDLGLLPILLWTCDADCDYHCQQLLTKDHLELGTTVHQYHGKWPFVRILGFQEPASVIFSILNFLANFYGLALIQDTRGPMAPYYKLFAFVGMNTWVWSSVFHTRDFLVTERLDYFSAIASIFYGLFIALVRALRLYKSPTKCRITGGILLTYYVYHIYYLSFVRFDYAYNMLVGVVAGLTQNMLWIYLSVREYNKTKQRMELLPVLLVVGLLGGMSFELFDFSPFFLTFDAHSLWHAATVLPTYYWYKYMRYDLHRRRVHKLD